jgi:hypothetical protein
VLNNTETYQLVAVLMKTWLIDNVLLPCSSQLSIVLFSAVMYYCRLSNTGCCPSPWFKLNIFFSCRLQRHFWFECLKKRKLPFLLAFYLILWRHHLAKYDVIVSRIMTSSSHKIWRHHLRNYDVIISQDMTSSFHRLWRHHLASDDVIIDFSSQIGTFVQSTRNVLP